MIHSFLLIGQSNMAGRGYVKDVPVLCDEGIKMFRNGLWQTMAEPIHYDRPFTGIGPGASFAAAWRQKNEGGDIGLIPCAEGASSLDDWAAGGMLFDHAVFQATLAMRTSRLDGILWHQGENDCNPEGAARYGEKFRLIAKTLRQELNAPDIPLMIGGLGDYLKNGKFGTHFTDFPLINQALQSFADDQKNCYFVTASGLESNEDRIHFNAPSQRIFGLRYFEAYDRRDHVKAPMEGEKMAIKALHDRPLSKSEKSLLAGNEFGRGAISMSEYESKLSEINGK